MVDVYFVQGVNIPKNNILLICSTITVEDDITKKYNQWFLLVKNGSFYPKVTLK
jgi:hypothetical protein